MNPTAYDLGQMALRIGVAWVFLYAAWRNTNTAAARSWTRGETALLFRHWDLAPDHWMVGLSAFIGMAMMYGGGLAVLAGCAPRPGGLALVLFSLMGIRIHAIRRDEAEAEAQGGVAIAWSAFGAHIAAGLKNWALIGAGIYFVLVGTGRWSLGPDWGAGIVHRLLGSG